MQVWQAVKLGTCCELEECEWNPRMLWKGSEKHATCWRCIKVNAVTMQGDVWMLRLPFSCSSNECQHGVAWNSWHSKKVVRCRDGENVFEVSWSWGMLTCRGFVLTDWLLVCRVFLPVGCFCGGTCFLSDLLHYILICFCRKMFYWPCFKSFYGLGAVITQAYWMVMQGYIDL